MTADDTVTAKLAEWEAGLRFIGRVRSMQPSDAALMDLDEQEAEIARTAMPALLAAVKDVLELHPPYPIPQEMIYGTITACSECGSVDDAPVEWPCPTVQALTKWVGGEG